MAGLQLPYSYDPTNPVAVDIRYGKISLVGGLPTTVPFADVAEACSLIPVLLRFLGLTVIVEGVDGVDEYWWKSATADADLILKTSGGGGVTDYNDLDNLPTLGTAAPLNVAASGDAAAGEVVKGDDTRLTNSRTPTAHDHDDRYYTESEVDSKVSTAENNAKAYTDTVIITSIKLLGDWDLIAQQAWPTGVGSGTSGAIRRNDAFRVSEPGIFEGQPYDKGDWIYAKIATPGQVSDNWGILDHNDQNASEAIRGTVLLATVADALARTNDTKAMTALKSIALIMDEKKNYVKETFVLSITEIRIPMQAAGQITSVTMDASMSNLQYKIGAAGVYAAFTAPVNYAAGVNIFFQWTYVSQADTSGWIRVIGRDS